MKRVMVWMWEHSVESIDPKTGKKLYISLLSETPVEGGKRRRVANYREKEHRRKPDEV